MALYLCRPKLYQSWALSVFFNFFNHKKCFFAFFVKLITYFCTIPIKKPTPSQTNLIKNAKNLFLLMKKFKKYLKCPALSCIPLMCMAKSPVISRLVILGRSDCTDTVLQPWLRPLIPSHCSPMGAVQALRPESELRISSQEFQGQ